MFSLALGRPDDTDKTDACFNFTTIRGYCLNDEKITKKEKEKNNKWQQGLIFQTPGLIFMAVRQRFMSLNSLPPPSAMFGDRALTVQQNKVVLNQFGFIFKF